MRRNIKNERRGITTRYVPIIEKMQGKLVALAQALEKTEQTS